MSDASSRELARSARSWLVPAKRVVVIRLNRSPFPAARVMDALIFWTLFNVLALVAGRMHPSTAAVVALISLSAVIAGTVAGRPGRAGLGIDGLWLASGSQRRFIAYRDVHRVRLTRIGVRVVHDDGTFTLAPMAQVVEGFSPGRGRAGRWRSRDLRAEIHDWIAARLKLARRCADPFARVALDAIAAAGNDVELDTALDVLPSATSSHRE